MAPVAKAQTIKQAKASFKARGRPSLTEKEQKQLERSLELEQRAERAKSAGERRAEAAKKRAEKEKKDKGEKQRLAQGSQRRCDRFGYKSSQFHLGAFFAGGGRGHMEAAKGVPREENVAEAEDDMFEDEDLDDEMLLQACDATPTKPQHRPAVQPISDASLMRPPPKPAVKTPAPVMQRAKPNAKSVTEEDLDSFWDDLESSTQIARELGFTKAEEPNQRNVSFNSGDFDLTEEDLNELDAPKAEAVRPPPLAVNDQTSMPPPARPAKPPIVHPTPVKDVQNSVRRQNVIRGPFLPASSLYCSPELGFTLTQLESFVDDDIQLSQAIPG